VNAYVLTADGGCGDSFYAEIVIAETPSRARYRFWSKYSLDFDAYTEQKMSCRVLRKGVALLPQVVDYFHPLWDEAYQKFHVWTQCWHCEGHGCEKCDEGRVIPHTDHSLCYAEWHRCDGGGPGEYERYLEQPR